MTEEILVGRQEELSAVRRAMDRRRNIVLFGEAGAGKTALLRRVLADREPGSLLFSAFSATLKESLVHLVLAGRQGQDDVKRKNILSLKRAFYPLLNAGPSCVVFDHLGRVGPKFCSFFEYLMDREVPLLLVCRGLTKADVGHLEAWLMNFEKREIRNLDKAGTAALVREYGKRYGLNLSRERDFAGEIFRVSKGNPGIVQKLCLLAQNGQYRRNSGVDVGLMDLDRRIREAGEASVRPAGTGPG